MNNLSRLIISLLFGLFVSGCMLGPDYERPELDTPADWRVEASEARDLSNSQWWQQFGDPVPRTD